MGAIRVAALSHSHVIYVLTHDSIGVGEDGPTHQPVEVLAALRAMPGMHVIRPADGNEVRRREEGGKDGRMGKRWGGVGRRMWQSALLG